MDLINAMDVFAMRLYKWAQDDFLREMESGCALLSLIAKNNPSVGGFVSWNKTLSTSDRKCVAKALTRMTHPNAAQLKGEGFYDETRRWTELCYQYKSNYQHNYFYLATADRSASTFRPLDVNSCLDQIVFLLSNKKEKTIRSKSRVRWSCKVDDWKIITDFIFEKRRERLCFKCQIVRKDGDLIKESGFGPFPRDLLSLYGIYNGTMAMVPSQADSEPMASAMVQLAVHFVSHAEELLVGLGVNDEELNLTVAQ